jgi:hypothetical protein
MWTDSFYGLTFLINPFNIIADRTNYLYYNFICFLIGSNCNFHYDNDCVINATVTKIIIIFNYCSC